MKALFHEVEGKNCYRVKKIDHPVSGIVEVPGSKSMTNRALLLAALSNSMVKLHGVLFSDDSRHFLSCLQTLGYELCIDEQERTVSIIGTGGHIPKKNATINVGSAGTAARFLTAMLALSDGEYVIECSSQMEKRPMKPLFDALTQLGAKFVFLKEEGFLPVKVIGNGGHCQDVSMDISTSTQFLSALLMIAPISKNGMNIHITSEKKQGSYIEITRRMLSQFGVITEFDGENYQVLGNQEILMKEYTIEPDVSAACYFYAIAALTGGKIIVKNVTFSLMQGDMQFLSVLERLGCEVCETKEGIQVTGPIGGEYQGIDIDMNNFSDQALTMAALAAYATSETRIRNIGHTRYQECNRMQAIVNELTSVGISCKECGDDLIITPGTVHQGIIHTYEDHRVAMAFTLLGLRTEGIIILEPECCKKTFETFFEEFHQLVYQE